MSESRDFLSLSPNILKSDLNGLKIEYVGVNTPWVKPEEYETTPRGTIGNGSSESRRIIQQVFQVGQVTFHVEDVNPTSDTNGLPSSVMSFLFIIEDKARTKGHT